MIKELILNEYSLAGQFSSKEDFIENALTLMVGLLNKLPQGKGISIWKRNDLWQSNVTSNSSDTLHDIIQTSRERAVTRFKALLTRHFFDSPYWDNNPKQDKDKTYQWESENVSGSALAEACERDKVIISWQHADFTQPSLSINKESEAIKLINLSKADDCDAQAVTFGWSPAPFSLSGSSKFSETSQKMKGAKVYKECSTGYYWYRDTFHNTHYEVFDANGRHIGEANLSGDLDMSKAKPGRRLTI